MLDLFGTKKKRRRQALWAQIAAELGGSFHPPAEWWRWRRKLDRIDARVGGVLVSTELYVVSTGKSAHPFTRVTAKLAYGPAPRVKVYRQGVFSTFGKVIGTQDVELGLPAFDSEFMVKADNAAVVRRLWSRDAAEQMLATFKSCQIVTEDDGIKLVSAGFWDERDKMLAGMALIADLASRDLYGAEGLRAVEGARFTQLPGERPRIELDEPVRVVIQAEDTDGVLATVARIGENHSHEAMEVEIVGGIPSDFDRASKLPQGAHVPMRAVGTGRLTIDAGGMRFTWRAVELDPDRLHAGAKLLGAIAAAERGGVYR